jgi:hypothetical protein
VTITVPARRAIPEAVFKGVPGELTFPRSGSSAQANSATATSDDVERDALAGEFDRVSVAELMGDETAAYSGVCGSSS